MATSSTPGFTGIFPDLVTAAYPLGSGYRWFMPGLMRFNAPDDFSPFGTGGINPYTYCAGDPINRSDPSGHMWEETIEQNAEEAAGMAETFTAAMTREEYEAAKETHNDKVGAYLSDPQNNMPPGLAPYHEEYERLSRQERLSAPIATDHAINAAAGTNAPASPPPVKRRRTDLSTASAAGDAVVPPAVPTPATIGNGLSKVDATVEEIFNAGKAARTYVGRSKGGSLKRQNVEFFADELERRGLTAAQLSNYDPNTLFKILEWRDNNRFESNTRKEIIENRDVARYQRLFRLLNLRFPALL